MINSTTDDAAPAHMLSSAEAEERPYIGVELEDPWDAFGACLILLAAVVITGLGLFMIIRWAIR